MKKLFALLLVFAMCFGTLAACAPSQPEGTEPPVTTTATMPPVEEDTGLADAAAYVKNIYKTVSEKTPQDFTRVGTVPVGDKKYEVVWTADVSEDLVKAVKNADGTVTIDVNEEATEDTPYVLTATITGSDGRTETLTWNHILPASLGGNMGAIVDAGYGLADGEALDGTYTLTGKIINVDTAWSSEYKNITVTIQVEGREDKPIMCYRLTGEDLDAVKALAYGDTITVSGTLKNYKGTIEFDAGCQLLEVVKGTGEGPVAPETYEEIVEAAYALAEGKSLPYTATLTGKVISIDYGYSEKYGDISLTFECRGKNFYCYRMTGPEEWLKQVGKGDWITVMGKIKNYYGTVEFDAGCKMIAYTDWNKAEDVGEANLVSELNVGDVIVMANGNIMMGKNASGSRLAGVEAEIVDDTVMVNEDMLQLTVSYNGTYYVFTDPNGKYLTTGETGGNLTLKKEMSEYAKWKVESAGDGVFYVTNAFAEYGGRLQQLEYYSGFTTYSPGTSDIYKIAFYKIGEGEAVEIPAEPEAPETPEEPFVKPTTPAEIVAAAYELESGETLPEGPYTLTGVITEAGTYSTQFGNVTVTIVVEGCEDQPIVCYRLSGEGADTLNVNDIITVEGELVNYGGTIEFNQGCTLTEVVDVEPPVVPEEPLDELPASLTYEFSDVTGVNVYLDDNALNVFLTAEDNNNLKSVTASNVTEGNGTGGAYPKQTGFLKSGSSANPGQLVLTYAEGVKVTKVEIKCYDWYKNNSTPNRVSVNGSAAQNAPTSVDADGNPVPETLTFTLDGTSNVVTIDTTNRAFIFEIVVYFAQ